MNVHSNAFLSVAILSSILLGASVWCTVSTSWEHIKTGDMDLGLYQFCYTKVLGSRVCASPGSDDLQKQISEMPGWSKPRFFTAFALPAADAFLGFAVILAFLGTLAPTTWESRMTSKTKRLFYVSIATSTLLVVAGTLTLASAINFLNYSSSAKQLVGDKFSPTIPGEGIDWFGIGDWIKGKNDQIKNSVIDTFGIVYELGATPYITIGVAASVLVLSIWSMVICWWTRPGKYTSGVSDF